MSVSDSAPNEINKQKVRDFLQGYQNALTKELESFDGQAVFSEDRWQREHLGHGMTRVIKDGNFFEQGGVNFSEIQGEKAPASMIGRLPELAGHPFWGAGVSLVLHPRNPFCPTVHLNYRYFQAGPVWWFAGGTDLTPYYAFHEDCVHWHRVLKTTMDRHDANYYPAFKYWCDEYFFNHHRSESRGIGGTFYDYLNGKAGLLVKEDYARHSESGDDPALQLEQKEKSWDDIFALQQDNAQCFFEAYLPIVEKRRAMAYTDQHRQFQLYRRGRYVEFNLLHDRGTVFGIQSKGRVESILMSLPPLVRWEYDFKAPADSLEAELTDKYLYRGIDWLK
jgi:coproporphyrinogen III oxidase